MSGTSEQHEPSEEALWLRDNWNDETMGPYRNKWIAVKGRGVERSSEDLDTLLEQTIGMNPLYAFVHLDALQ